MEDDYIHGPTDSAERYNGPTKKRPLSAETKKSFFEARRQRLENIQPSISIVSDIFKGVWIYFEGYTDSLSSLHLKKLVQSNGGNCTPYFSVKRITHIVCTGLSASKSESLIKRMESLNKHKIFNVNPDWILESIRANKKLSELDFAVLKPKHEQVERFLQPIPKKTEIQHSDQPAKNPNTNPSPSLDPHITEIIGKKDKPLQQNIQIETNTTIPSIPTPTKPHPQIFPASSPQKSRSSLPKEILTTPKTPTQNIRSSQTTSTVDRGNKIVQQMQKILHEQKPTSLLENIPKAQRTRSTNAFHFDPQMFTVPPIHPTPK
eukprot:TRINITY_DN6526_c0_g1_i1.p1 TRINITY_DN6526_c0_g1~~TRINITY_DN6526_c0_g1_i1.p1  ORF type:complete len:319 (+),score=73.78 TRINITY_DN6526_c0_g1_i1:753-1709(+)